MASEAGQQHPLGIYYKIWILLFVLSLFSYMVDYLDVQGVMRWTLVLLFMALKAGFILAIFMHVKWERMALVIMAVEGNYTESARVQYLGHDANQAPAHVEH